jgi:quercetin dioxygenase-like cupin family protein
MNIQKINSVKGEVNRRGVVAKELINHEHVKVMNLVMDPGDNVPEHAVPVDVFFYVVTGKGTLKIGDETAVVEANDIIECPKNTKMALWADQGEKFSVLNVKTPTIK